MLCLGPVSGICFIVRTRKKFQTHLNLHKLKAQFDSSHETLLSLVKSRACLQRCPMCNRRWLPSLFSTARGTGVKGREGSSPRLLSCVIEIISLSLKKKKNRRKKKKNGRSLATRSQWIKGGLKVKKYEKENHPRDIFPCIP